MTQIIGKLYEKLWRKVGRKTWWQILVGVFTWHNLRTFLVVKPWKIR
jgi:hypothetical protein